MTTTSNQSESRRWSNEVAPDHKQVDQLRNTLDQTLSPSTAAAVRDPISLVRTQHDGFSPSLDPKRLLPQNRGSLAKAMSGTLPEVPKTMTATMANNDTPATTAPSSPRLMGNTSAPPSSAGSDTPSQKLPMPIRQNSGTNTPRVRPTTLDIPGLTKSKVSPDGRIASRDVGSKLVIVMVGLPARGKSYITKKLARYLNWLQHDTRIFNVGERRRVVAGGPNSLEKTKSQQLQEDLLNHHRPSVLDIAKADPLHNHHMKQDITDSKSTAERQHSVAQLMLNDDTKIEAPGTPPRSTTETQPPEINGNTNHDREEVDIPALSQRKQSMATIVLSKDAPEEKPKEEEESMEQNASFFDPQNKRAAQIREQVARETLDELLDYILYENGAVGILDATNSTMERRKMIMDRIRERAGPQLNVLFLESSCVDHDLLEANMRLKLNGPDYKEMDPVIALEDFKKRVREYEKSYVPLGEYEEKNNMPYIQMIDVGRKVISHQIKGFLMAQANYYLLNFNLAPRQIWITRHGLSMDNVSGKIGGDSDLAPEGHQYARSLSRFMEQKRQEWDMKQIENLRNTHFPPQPGDVTPPNPYFHPQSPGSENGSVATDATDLGFEPKAFCVWTSMLKRSIQTAQYFNDEEYDTKQMRMLDELNAGVMEGLTYSCISTQYPEEYKSRKADKLHYRYPGPGGEGYLDIINRLRPVIVELERMEDHVLLVGHRSVARVLLAYFRGLRREEVADLDVPIGMLYCLEPKPYGVDFKAYQWDKATEWFYEVPDFKLRRAEDDML
ncbi:hypothetical protein PRZ48_003234 [Zasmidium cellare]|uniref:6-phosphofructo-2-kinase domain-containing protein n=1 Tax=Zasmidium cellare TaxID=395010 RepID=A0ABR0EVR3_ZASCE|nr:hypothetical protein PRZ48_003234 [Zasmidium cellare]